MAFDPDLRAHQEWLGYLQPVGLVVAPPALLRAQAVVSRNLVGLQQTLLEHVVATEEHDEAHIADLPAFLRGVLRWSRSDIAGDEGGPELPESLEVTLEAYRETLRPTYAVPDPEAAADAETPWLMLIQVHPIGTALDKANESVEGWKASPQEKFERLLRQTGIATGLLCNGDSLRLVHAPHGEASGHLTFPVQAMTEVGGRPILGGLELLLHADRVFDPDKNRRLTGILEESRKYQATVSTQLSGQVLEALHHLLQGMQAADENAGGRILRGMVPDHADQVYGGLVTVLMRIVFLLYAEHQGLMPKDPVYVRHYSVSGLFDRLRADAGLYPDTMDQRYGAWAHLLSLFRLVHDGGAHAGLRLPPRKGELFDPDRYPFLEGRMGQSPDPREEPVEAPRVSDGAIWKVLKNLLILNGEQLSYRRLGVEDIGSVYEAIMGFMVERIPGHALALRPKEVVVDLDRLLLQKPKERAKWLLEQADCKMPPVAGRALEEAKTIDDLVAALGSRASAHTPAALPEGSLVLQPGEERRRTGSHYTPRTLTEPIVRTTLRPALEALGEHPTPEQILDLKVCDPAMGSGAFLVEACRQLAEKLVGAWEYQKRLPELPPDEEPYLHARRLVAQRCLYGVDKNPFAVSLAKLSLWLVTLASDHAFTFVDHAIKHGDSLVGLGKQQIAMFQWDVESDSTSLPILAHIVAQVGKAKAWRAEIWAKGDERDDEKRVAWKDSEDALAEARLKGDLLVAAFFAGRNPKERETKRRELLDLWRRGFEDGNAEAKHGVVLAVGALRRGERPVPAFHWEIEFPEVFERENQGFDGVVGNPPFAGKNTLAAANHVSFPDWLKAVHEGSHGNADLVAHFFRRAFRALRPGGTFGLIATNTIGQGDTRSTGLRWIRANGGWIYNVTKRLKWPGLAAVVVSVVHVRKAADGRPQAVLDGRPVPRISAFLFAGGSDEDPAALAENAGKSFIGSYVLGMGFTFDDTNPEATPIAEMHRLIVKDPRNAERVFPYIGGEEVNSSPTQTHHRYVINFGEMTEEEAREWPDLMEIVERKVRGTRGSHSTAPWWQLERGRPELYRALGGLERVLVNCQVGPHLSFAYQPIDRVFAHTLDAFPMASIGAFPVLQSRIHEVWARLLGSSMKDDLRYTPADCFETFPFPPNWTTDPALEAVGQAYYDYRAALMIRNNQGLTATYNRFHDPDETDPEILELRRLHAAMDRAVLDAYGWTDIPTDCVFRLDYEEPEDEDSEGAGTRKRKKKPWRLRWPEAVHDEVLARLLALNQQRAAAERAQALLDEKPKKTSTSKPSGKPRGRPPKAATPRPLDLFHRDDDE